MDIETLRSYTDDELRESVEVIHQALRHYEKLLEDTGFSDKERKVIQLNHHYTKETLDDLLKEQESRRMIEEEANKLVVKEK
jgi:hypothetical protein